MEAVEVIVCICTAYAEPYIGGPLFCGGTYAADTAPWVALPYRDYRGSWDCGEPVYLSGVDAYGSPWSLYARAMDTGPFGALCVKQPDGSCPQIVADVPMFLAPFSGLSSACSVRMMAREAAAMGMVQ